MVYISGGNELLDAFKILEKLGVKTGHKVADLGCGGAGHFTITTAQLVGRNTNMFAVDILKSVLKSVQSKARLEGVNNIKSVWSNLEIFGATKIRKGSLDFALLINILFQSKQHENIFKEAIRMLKNEGRILAVDWNKIPSTFGPSPADRVPINQIKDTAKKLKLKLIDEFAAGNYHYGLIFEK